MALPRYKKAEGLTNPDKYIEYRFDAITTLVNAQFESMNFIIDEHFKATNGRVSKLEKIAEERQLLHTRAKWAKKYWYILLLTCIGFVIIVMEFYEHGLIREIVNVLASKI